MTPRELPPELAAALDAHRARLGPFGEPCLYYDEVGSTNDVAAALAAAGEPEGTAVVAASQTHGRGRRGRAWCSPPGAGLYVTVILRPPSSVAPLVTLTGGVAAAEGIRRATGLPVELKWPNDLVVGRPWRKLGGLLAEASSAAAAVEWVVLGIGVNLRAAPWPPEVARVATAIEVELGRPVDPASVLVEVLAALRIWYTHLVSGGAPAVLARWQDLAPGCRDRPVEWESAEGRRRGVAAGIDADGALCVRVGPDVHRLVSAEVTWL